MTNTRVIHSKTKFLNELNSSCSVQLFLALIFILFIILIVNKFLILILYFFVANILKYSINETSRTKVDRRLVFFTATHELALKEFDMSTQLTTLTHQNALFGQQLLQLDKEIGYNGNRNLKISKALLKSQSHQLIHERCDNSKGVFQGGSREAQARFPEYQEGTE